MLSTERTQVAHLFGASSHSVLIYDVVCLTVACVIVNSVSIVHLDIVCKLNTHHMLRTSVLMLVTCKY